MIIPSKHCGYSEGGRVTSVRRVYGGGSSGPTTSTVNNVNIPAYAQPYVEDMLGRGQALSTQNTYQPYTGQRVAGATDLQNQSYGAAANMQPAQGTGAANWVGYDTSDRAQALQNQGYDAGQFSALGPQSVYASPNAQMTRTGNFNDPGVAQSYMNPYMQQVVDIQKREATRQSDMMGQQQGAQAAGMGAFGGSRQAIVDSERNRNLGIQLNDIQSQGANAAWQQAQQAFQADAGRGLTSQMANQQAGLTAAGQNLQGQMANQNAWTQYGNQNLQAQQLGEQSRQFGANYGLQGLNTELAAGNLLQGVGQSQYNQNLGIAGLQNQFGTQQQATNQQGLDVGYSNYANQQEFPYKNLDFMSGLIHGLPLTQTSTSMYQAPPSPVSQLAGLGTAAYGMSRLGAFKKGGVVKKYARGGIVDCYAEGGDVSAPESARYYLPYTQDNPTILGLRDMTRSSKPKPGQNRYDGPRSSDRTPYLPNANDSVMLEYNEGNETGLRKNANNDPRSFTKYANGGEVGSGLADLLISKIN